MAVQHKPCDPDTIDRFLGDQLGEAELRSLEDHLEGCAACRACLDSRAAEGSWWDEVRGYLRGSDLAAAGTSVPGDEATDGPSPLHGLENYLAPTDDPRMLGRLGGYEIVGVVGRGGMGVVLKAWDAPLGRYVAVKVLAPHLATSAAARQRFAREARAAAAVVHDNVMAIHAVAEANGLPYFVMPYVPGPSLERRLREVGAFPVEAVLRVGTQIAAGLAAAHAQGLVHRDIKPANILLEDTVERVRITDFGLARAVDDASLTRSGVIAGTPEYMSPEQVRGEAVDSRSDLFSLGSVLYALCTGRPPFRASTTMGVLWRVEEDRPRPVRDVNADSEWLARVIAKLQAKDPAERFQSAAEVAALLEGYLAHLRQPATAPAPELPPRPAGARHSPAGRRPGVLLLAAVLAVVAVGSSEVAGWTNLRGLARRLLVSGGILAAAPDRAPPADAPVPLVWRLHGHTGAVHGVRFTPDGRRLVTAAGWPGDDYSVRVWDLATGQQLLQVSAGGQVGSLDVSADGRLILVGVGDGPVLYLDIDSGRAVRSLKGHGRWGASWVAFARDGRHAYSASQDGTARLWDLNDGHEVRRFRVAGKWARLGAESADGRRLLTADDTGTLQFWDVATGEELKRIALGRAYWVSALALTPDGRQALVGAWDGSLWDLETGEKVRTFEGHGDEVHEMLLTPDGRRLLTASFDGKLRLWDFQTGQLPRVLGAHEEFLFAAALSPDGRQVATAGGGRRGAGKKFLPGSDHDVRVWDVSGVLADAAAPPKSGARGWLAALELVGLVVTLSAALGLWLYVRRRRPGERPDRPSQLPAVPPPLSFACGGCGKKLRAKPALAGRTVQCPGCGHAVDVPGT